MIKMEYNTYYKKNPILMTKIKGKKSTFIKDTPIIIFRLYLFLLLLLISKEQDNDEIENSYSYIELNVKGKGNTNIFYINEEKEACQGLIPPDKIQINNDEPIQNPGMKHNLINEENNYVKLIWIGKSITTLHCLFHKSDKITYIDFSHFNSTFVDSLNDLFNDCKSLTSINFNNFDTSKVTDMHWMFQNCKSLKSIDLSNFDTSKVQLMNALFYECNSLEYINISSKFDTSSVINMDSIFRGCNSLISLNLSNFNTSNVENMAHMFADCHKLEFLDLSNFDTSKVTNMSNIFENCKQLKSINLSNFNTSNVESMYFMFSNCENLISIDISNFDTSKVTTFSRMFQNCKSLKSINVSNFNTPVLMNTSFMFSGCEDLTYIDISNFDMTELTLMSLMFRDCKKLISVKFPKSKAPKLYKFGSLFKNCESLISVDLSNFVTTNVIYMDSMFSNCKSLTSINLSHFDTSNMVWINDMFNGCSNLEYINLQNVVETDKIKKINNVFKNTPDNLVICLDQGNAPILTNLIKEKNCYTIYCGDDWIKHQKKIIKDTNACADSCNISINYEFEFNSRCYDSCEYGFFYDKENPEQKRCKCNLDKCLICSNIELTKDLCISCNDSYYPKENDPTNILPYINCYKDPEGYYFDGNIYKECFYTCKSCNIGGDNIIHNCSECKDNFTFKFEYEGSLNCYENCIYYYYFDENRNYYCTINDSCPNEYNKLIPDKRECLNNCSLDDTYKFEFRNICYSECPKEKSKESKDNYCEALCNEEKPFVIVQTQECVDFCLPNLISTGECIYKYNYEIDKEEGNDKINEEEKKIQEIKMQNKIIENVEKGFTSDKYDATNVDNGIDDVIETETMTITLTTTDNQKNQNSENINTTTIDLGECENLIRQEYNISDEQKLYIKK